MSEAGRIPAERAVEQQLPRRVRDVVVATDDVRDLHLVVVHHAREVVGRKAVRAQQHEVVEEVVLERHHLAYAVFPRGLAAGIERESNRGRAPLGLEPRAVGLGQVSAAPIVARRLPTLEHAAPLLELLRRAIAAVRERGDQQRFRVTPVVVAALGLKVRAVIATDLGTFIPIEPEPPQPIEDRRDRGVGRARRVGVLDPQHERAAVGPREQPVVEGRARTPDVKKPGRARRESDTNAHPRTLVAAERSGQATTRASI